MPLTTDSGLVAGAFVQPPEPTTTVRLLRAIFVAGKRVEPGVMALPKALASMLIGANKAERVPEAKPAPVIQPPVVEEVRAPRAQRKET
jgi:hypothetical protein